MELAEKFKKLIKKYPNPTEYIQKLMIGGALLGATGLYTIEELVNMNRDVYGLLGKIMSDTIDVESMAEAFLLLEGKSREFIEKVVDAILEEDKVVITINNSGGYYIPENAFVDLYGIIYEPVMENGLYVCPKCRGHIVPLNPHQPDPDEYLYRCNICKMDFKVKNKADKDFKLRY